MLAKVGEQLAISIELLVKPDAVLGVEGCLLLLDHLFRVSWSKRTAVPRRCHRQPSSGFRQPVLPDPGEALFLPGGGYRGRISPATPAVGTGATE